MNVGSSLYQTELGTLLELLIVLLSFSISIIALWKYILFRSWKLLALSVSFLLMGVPSIIMFYIFSGFFGEPLNIPDIVSLFKINIYLGLILILGVSLLAYVYYRERKERSIKISKAQWIVGIIPIIWVAFFAIGLLLFVINNGSSYVTITSSSSLPVEYYVYSTEGSIIYIIEIYIVISLYSQYRIIKNTNTIFVLSGFLCFLLTPIISYIIFSSGYAFIPDMGVNYVPRVIGLFGYLMILVALLRLRGSR